MQIKYQSSNYDWAMVTGRYIRVDGSQRKGYSFRVFETLSGTGTFKGRPGHGPTTREYVTDGEEIPADVRARAIASKCTELWDNPNTRSV